MEINTEQESGVRGSSEARVYQKKWLEHLQRRSDSRVSRPLSVSNEGNPTVIRKAHV
jgi:hypothetical protein